MELNAERYCVSSRVMHNFKLGSSVSNFSSCGPHKTERFSGHSQCFFNVMNDGFSERLLLGLVAGNDFSLSVHEKFLEVPSDLPGEWRVFCEITVERVLLFTKHGNFAEERKFQGIFRVTKFCNFLVVARFLFAKIVGGEG